MLCGHSLQVLAMRDMGDSIALCVILHPISGSVNL